MEEYKIPDVSSITNPKLANAIILMSGAEDVAKRLSNYLAEVTPTIVYSSKNKTEDNIRITNLDIDYLIKAVEYIKMQQDMATDVLSLTEEAFNHKYSKQ